MSEQELQQEAPEEQVEQPENQVPSFGDDVPHETPEPEGVVAIAEIEEAARAQGWSPDKGDKTALQFLKDGQVYRDRMYDQIKELREENRQAYQVIAEKFNQQEHNDYQQRVAAHEEQLSEAVRDGDVERFNELRQEYPQAPQPMQPKVDPGIQYVEQWRAENQWFDNDPQLKQQALGFYQAEKLALEASGGIEDPSIILPKVKEQLQMAFPQKFDDGTSNPNAGRGAGADPKPKAKASKKGGLQRSDLTPTEGAMFDDLLKTGLSEDKLLKSIERQRKAESER